MEHFNWNIGCCSPSPCRSGAISAAAWSARVSLLGLRQWWGQCRNHRTGLAWGQGHRSCLCSPPETALPRRAAGAEQLWGGDILTTFTSYLWQLRRSLWFSTDNTFFGETYRVASSWEVGGTLFLKKKVTSIKSAQTKSLQLGANLCWSEKRCISHQAECQWLIASQVSQRKEITLRRELKPFCFRQWQGDGIHCCNTPAHSTRKSIINLKTLQKQETFWGSQISEILTIP